MAKRATGLVLLGVFLSACATLPAGPSVMVWPGPGKPFEQFQADDALCRQWAYQQLGTTPGQAASESTASGAAIGTLLGAAAGAAIGAASGHVGAGAAIGAGTGLLAGTAAGLGAGEGWGGAAQRRYDIAYQQCMYAKGNQIPAVGSPWRRYYYGVPPPPPPPPAPPPASQVPAPPAQGSPTQ